MTRHDLDWLRKNALFSCSGPCADEVSHHADDLRILPDGDLICDGCFDDEPPLFAPGCDESNADPLLWRDLQPFDPFENLVEVKEIGRDP